MRTRQTGRQTLEWLLSPLVNRVTALLFSPQAWPICGPLACIDQFQHFSETKCRISPLSTSCQIVRLTE